MYQFISGNLAMMITGLWQIPAIRSKAPDLTNSPVDAAEKAQDTVDAIIK